MTGKRFASIIALVAGATVLLCLTFVTLAALVYSLSSGRGTGTYAAILGGCIAAWVAAFLVRRRSAGRGDSGRR